MAVVTLPDAGWIERVGPVPGAECLTWDLSGPAPRADEVEFVVPPYRFTTEGFERFAQLPALRHVQLLLAGYDHAVPFLPPGVSLGNAAGVHDAATAELTLTLILAAQRALPQFVRAQEQGAWLRLPMQPGLADRSVLIVGYGGIGAAIARRLAPFEAQISAVATAARPGDAVVPSVHGLAELDQLLPEHDIVVLIVPLSESTEHLVDRRFLARMKEGALLVNVARGKVVDTEALIEACAAGRVRAALDVTDPEPLPDGHPLFTTPNVLVVPHVGGQSQAFFPRGAALLRDQIAAHVAGRPLRNVAALG